MHKVKQVLDNYWQAVDNYYRVIVQTVWKMQLSKTIFFKKEGKKTIKKRSQLICIVCIPSGNTYIVKNENYFKIYLICWLAFWTIKLEISTVSHKVFVYSDYYFFKNHKAKVTFPCSRNLVLVSLNVPHGILEGFTWTESLSQVTIIM